MKKSFLSTIAIIVAMSMLVLTGCGSSAARKKKASAAGDWTWEHNIEIICPWGTGGGADTTLRAFAAALENEIGVKVVVNNKSGAGGVTGVKFASLQPADGYTYVLCSGGGGGEVVWTPLE